MTEVLLKLDYIKEEMKKVTGDRGTRKVNGDR